MADVIVVGGCIIDLISYAPRFPRPGETLAGHDFRKGFGGKGANQCVMADLLGTKTALIAKLGEDSFGHEYIKSMKESNIITDFITFSDCSSTSTAGICVTDEGLNNIIYVPGAIMKLTPDDINKAENLISKSKVLLCTYECPVNTLLEALSTAKKHKVLTVVNAAPSGDSSYEQLYPLIDIICLNEVEAEDATGISIQSIKDAEMAMNCLIDKQCSTVILTMGDKGVVFKSKDDPGLVYIAAKTVVPVDTTGAGDAFMGSLVYFLSRNSSLSLKEMIHRSCAIATKSVLKHGTQTSFPHRQEVMEYLSA